MFAFIVRRILQAIVVMLIISFIGFALKQNVGDPVRELTGISVSAAERDAIREKLGLNDPFLVQYGRFLRGAMHGDIGQSFFYKKPAMEVILSKAPATLELVLVCSFLIVVLSIPMGIYSAIYPKRLLSRLIMGLSTIGVSVPIFLIAILLIYVFAIELNWLPSYGRGETVNVWGWESGLLTADGLRHLILPATALTALMLPLFVRLIRSEMMEVLESEYVKFAWAKGLPRVRIWFVHAFKNTLLPVITVGGVQIGTMIAFTILTETVFQWGGLGFLFLEAVERADTSLLVAYLIFVGVVYGLVNPMVRITGRK